MLWDDNELRADLTAIRDERAVFITFVRNGVQNGSFKVRVAGKSAGTLTDGVTTTSSTQPIAVLADAGIDIAVQDTFKYETDWYRVTAVRPHRDIMTRIDAERFE